MFDLTGKVAVITGASSGLGIQFAQALAKQGASVAILARSEDKLRSVKQNLEKKGSVCIAICCDVTNENLVNEAIDAIIKKCGKIDILVNNAGAVNTAPSEQLTMQEWDKVLDVNLRSVFMMSSTVGRHMIEKKYGKIVNISSMYGFVANTMYPLANYHASKHGVIGLTKALAIEWAKYNITVNSIAPGFFKTEMTSDDLETEEFNQFIQTFSPMKRIGREGELDGALVYLASDASSFMTGQTLIVDGGWTSI
ncbi:SDR family oxidoreductase [Candidatus Woesebacteria bacterium]|nr:SDR family oxidoreductase [Candidatus Woesebacteria bacterium]